MLLSSSQCVGCNHCVDMLPFGAMYSLQNLASSCQASTATLLIARVVVVCGVAPMSGCDSAAGAPQPRPVWSWAEQHQGVARDCSHACSLPSRTCHLAMASTHTPCSPMSTRRYINQTAHKPHTYCSRYYVMPLRLKSGCVMNVHAPGAGMCCATAARARTRCSTATLPRASCSFAVNRCARPPRWHGAA